MDPRETNQEQHSPALLTVLDTSELETTGLAERLACRRSHAIGINVISRVQGTVVVGGLAVTADICPVGVGDRLDSGGAVGLSWQRLADDSTKLSRELLCKKKVSRRARGSDTAGNVVHKLRVAADALRIALALGRKFLDAFLLHVC